MKTIMIIILVIILAILVGVGFFVARGDDIFSIGIRALLSIKKDNLVTSVKKMIDSPSSNQWKPGGYIERYSLLPNAFEKKQSLFNSGAIEEITSSFGIAEGYFGKTNTSGDGWSYIKNGWPVVWDGTPEGTMKIYYTQYNLSEKDAKEKGIDTGVLTEDGLVNYITQADTSKELECFIGFPIHVDLKQDIDFEPENERMYAQSYQWRWEIEVPNTVIEKASIEELIGVFAFIHQAIMEYSTPSEISLESLKIFTHDRIREGPPNELVRTPILAENLSRIREFANDFESFKKCYHKEMTLEELGAKVPEKFREAIKEQQKILWERQAQRKKEKSIESE